MYAPLDFAFFMALYLFPYRRPRVLGMQLRQLAQYFLGALVLNLGSYQGYFHDLVAVRAFAGIQNALLPQAELLPILRPWRDLEESPAVDGRDLALASRGCSNQRSPHAGLGGTPGALEY